MDNWRQNAAHLAGFVPMAMICPQCNGYYEQQLECPTCRARLVFDPNPRRDDEQWQQTPWGRIVVGLLFAQGLAYGLQLAAKAGFQVTDDATGQNLWSTLPGILLVCALQGFSLMVGGIITGAGQQRGILFGGFVGLVNGLIFLFVQLGGATVLNELAMYAQPVLHLAFGAAGGFIGTLIWKPLPKVKILPLADFSQVRVVPAGPHFFAGPVAWIRVLAGVALVVAGVVWSRTILEFILESSEGKLTISTHWQARMVIWEISAIAALIGAGLAGATTANGMKQGLVVGLFTAVVLLGVYLGNPKTTLNITASMVGSLVVMTSVGGWFGGQLFPPIVANSRRRRISAA